MSQSACESNNSPGGLVIVLFIFLLDREYCWLPHSEYLLTWFLKVANIKGEGCKHSPLMLQTFGAQVCNLPFASSLTQLLRIDCK